MTVFDSAGRPKIAYNPTTRLSAPGATFVSQVALVAGTLVLYKCVSAGTILGVTLATQGGPGSCVVDIWKTSFGSFPPTVANTICASDLPTISGGSTYNDTALTGWTTSYSAGDWIAFSLKSTSVFTYILCELTVQQ